MSNLKWIEQPVWQKPSKKRNIAFYTLCTNNEEKSTLLKKNYPLKINFILLRCVVVIFA